ncbi:MAG: hypothetical protein HOY76_14395 [Streptomyces sp.]|nr:hypothetical protein [Streptomyces sp.]
MPYIRKDKAGSCPGHTWENDGDVVEVDDPVLVADLLEIPGFSEVAPPKDDTGKDNTDKSDSAGSDEEPSTPKRGRPRKTAQSQTEINE